MHQTLSARDGILSRASRLQKSHRYQSEFSVRLICKSQNGRNVLDADHSLVIATCLLHVGRDEAASASLESSTACSLGFGLGLTEACGKSETVCYVELRMIFGG